MSFNATNKSLPALFRETLIYKQGRDFFADLFHVNCFSFCLLSSVPHHTKAVYKLSISYIVTHDMTYEHADQLLPPTNQPAPLRSPSHTLPSAHTYNFVFLDELLHEWWGIEKPA